MVIEIFSRPNLHKRLCYMWRLISGPLAHPKPPHYQPSYHAGDKERGMQYKAGGMLSICLSVCLSKENTVQCLNTQSTKLALTFKVGS